MSDRRDYEPQAPEPREITLLYRMDADGGFLVGNTRTRVASYAYPTSDRAEAAEINPEGAAIAADRANHSHAEQWTRELNPKASGVFPTVEDRRANAEDIRANDASYMTILEAGRDDGSTKTLQIMARDYHAMDGKGAAAMDAALESVEVGLILDGAEGLETPPGRWGHPDDYTNEGGVLEIPQAEPATMTEARYEVAQVVRFQDPRFYVEPGEPIKDWTCQKLDASGFASIGEARQAPGFMDDFWTVYRSEAGKGLMAFEDFKTERKARDFLEAETGDRYADRRLENVRLEATPADKPGRWGHEDDYADFEGTLEIPQQEQGTMAETKADVPAASQARWDAIEAAQTEAETGRALTAEDITANPWNAVFMRVDDPALYQAVIDTSDHLYRETAPAWEAHGLNGDGFALDYADQRAGLLRAEIASAREQETGLPGIGAPVLQDTALPLRRAEDHAERHQRGPLETDFLIGLRSQIDREQRAIVHADVPQGAAKMEAMDRNLQNNLGAFDRPAHEATKALDAGRVMTQDDLAARLRETPAQARERHAQSGGAALDRYAGAILDGNSKGGRDDD